MAEQVLVDIAADCAMEEAVQLVGAVVDKRTGLVVHSGVDSPRVGGSAFDGRVKTVMLVECHGRSQFEVDIVLLGDDH